MSNQYKREDLENLLYREIVEICKELSIKVKGKKEDLIEKVLEQTSTRVAKTTSKRAAATREVIPPPAKVSAKKPGKKPAAKKPAASIPTTTTTLENNTAQEVPQVTVESTSSSSSTTSEASIVQEAQPTTSNNAATTEEVIPPPKDADPDNEVVALRMTREGCNTGELHASLIWQDIADLDLHVQTPKGEHLFFGNRESVCGGWLDKDMNVQVTQYSEEPIENIFWSSAPSGKYKIWVRNYNCHTSSDPRFNDRSRSVPFRVRLIRGTQTDWFQGSVKDGKEVTCFEFTLQGKGAVGSFVALPPNDVPSTFKELAIKNNIAYSQGEGYYALKKKEEISEKKDMVLHDITADTFIIGHYDVCTKLNQPTDKRLTLVPSDIPTGFRLFVQSTSHNRKIPADTHVLLRVSVREALRYRQPSRYSFR